MGTISDGRFVWICTDAGRVYAPSWMSRRWRLRLCAQLRDVCGAGDTVLTVLGAAEIAGNSIYLGCKLAVTSFLCWDFHRIPTHELETARQRLPGRFDAVAVLSHKSHDVGVANTVLW